MKLRELLSMCERDMEVTLVVTISNVKFESTHSVAYWNECTYFEDWDIISVNEGFRIYVSVKNVY